MQEELQERLMMQGQLRRSLLIGDESNEEFVGAEGQLPLDPAGN